MSFSKRSGIAGTEGWIAAEMMNANARTVSLIIIIVLLSFSLVIQQFNHRVINITCILHCNNKVLNV